MAAILQSAPHRQNALRSSRRAHRTSSGSRSPACTSDAPSSASLRTRSSSASCSRRPCRSVLYGASVFRIGLQFPPLFCLRLAGAKFLLAQDGLDTRNIPAQPANLFQALGLSHVHLELQLKKRVRQIPLLMPELDVG